MKTESETSLTPIWDDFVAENTGFKTADYSQQVYAEIELEVHKDRGFTKSEKPEQIKRLQDVELKAIRQLSSLELQAAAGLQVRPSRYLRQKPQSPGRGGVN